jgi:hypothetical protein
MDRLKALSISAGVFMALLAIYFSYGLLVGNYWSTPVNLSLWLILIFPAVLYYSAGVTDRALEVKLLLSVIAIIMDIILINSANGNRHSSFYAGWFNGDLLAYVWLMLWISWQVILGVGIFSSFRKFLGHNT